MEEFIPNQRYSSLGEPELGVGTVTEVSKGKVQIFFPLANEKRLYATESAPLIRTVFRIGDTITDQEGQSLVVEDVTLQDGLYVYFGQGIKMHEASLGAGTVARNVQDRLFAGEVDSLEMFALRRESLYHDYNRKKVSVFGFVGGKIDLIPHQLYIAHEVSERFAPRVLLSDQVGLGKTIEACLILHRMLVSGRISRAMIVVPESLVHQWFVEMYRKFNLWFHIFDEARSASLEESAPDGNPFLDDQLIICSIEFLANSQKRSAQAIAAHWDMLVVDEAHHLAWSEKEVSSAYQIVELLSQSTKGLLLLTATPEQLGAESHFARLRLLDPVRYNNYHDFVHESKGNKEMALLMEKLSTDQTLDAHEIECLEKLFSKERIAQLPQGQSLLKHQLIEDVLDQYGPGRNLFRNTRLAMKGFPKRIAHLVPIQPKENQEFWIGRSNNEFLIDANQDGATPASQGLNFGEDPRLDWLLNKMETIYPEKILLICRSKEKVLALEAAISERIRINAGVFHEELTLVQRDRNAAWFADHEEAQILLCSEIGSEGRNFQFVHHLVLFDVPFHPELLEQRIGRLDRIGQKNDIHIHVPYFIGSPQNALINWLHEGLDAFETNLEGGNVLYQKFNQPLMEICRDFSTNEKQLALKKLIAETQQFQQKLKKNLAEGRDRMLEMNSFRPEIAEKLIQQIQAQDKDTTLESYLIQVFQYFDVEMEDLAARTYLLHPSAMISEAFPSIPREGIPITFDRKRAIRRDDVHFLSWEHPMVVEALDKILGTDFGSASFGILRGSEDAGLLLELLFVLETAGEERTAIDRFLPNTPIRIIVDHTGNEVTEDFSADFFNKRLALGEVSKFTDNEVFVEILLPKMIEEATHLAEEASDKEIDQALQRMNAQLNHEIARLKHLQKLNPNIRDSEIQTAVDEQEKLTALIQKARIRLDAILLIQKE